MIKDSFNTNKFASLSFATGVLCLALSFLFYFFYTTIDLGFAIVDLPIMLVLLGLVCAVLFCTIGKENNLLNLFCLSALCFFGFFCFVASIVNLSTGNSYSTAFDVFSLLENLVLFGAFALLLFFHITNNKLFLNIALLLGGLTILFAFVCYIITFANYFIFIDVFFMLFKLGLFAGFFLGYFFVYNKK